MTVIEVLANLAEINYESVELLVTINHDQMPRSVENMHFSIGHHFHEPDTSLDGHRSVIVGPDKKCWDAHV